MREIKFRAWDVSNNEIYQVGTLVFEKATGNLAETLDPIMQYTGLKDSSNPPKEIYEGDICRLSEIGVRDMSDPNPFIRIIKWNDENGGFGQFRINGEESGSGWSFCQQALGKYYEVIGNIYENPELLK